MKFGGRFLRYAVVCVSVFLGAGYVYLSSGGKLPWQQKRKMVMASSKLRQIISPKPVNELLAAATVQPAEAKVTAAPTTLPRERLMPSSKSAGHVIESENILYADGHVDFQTDSSTQPATSHRSLAEQKSRVREFLMSSSKSGIISPRAVWVDDDGVARFWETDELVPRATTQPTSQPTTP